MCVCGIFVCLLFVCVNQDNTAASIQPGYRQAMLVGLYQNITFFDTQSNMHRLNFSCFFLVFYSVFFIRYFFLFCSFIYFFPFFFFSIFLLLFFFILLFFFLLFFFYFFYIMQLIINKTVQCNCKSIEDINTFSHAIKHRFAVWAIPYLMLH